MIEARFGGTTATLLLDGSVLVAGGTDSVGFLLASAELYDPGSGSWTATGSMIAARGSHTATLLPDGRVLVAGGNSDGEPYTLASAELYDPTSGSWTATASMIEARGGHTATLLPDGKVLVAGGVAAGIGEDIPPALASAELYDPVSSTWTATASMPEARSAHTATPLLDGRVLVAGGQGTAGSALLESAELYDPGSGSWSATGGMIDDRLGHTATLLPDGRVLVAGGVSLSFEIGALASAELYVPVSGTWTATASMPEARSGSATPLPSSHTATLLPDGGVLVAGGYTGGGGALASAELYDPRSGSWTTTARMIEARGGYTATLLPDGKVLVAGGGGAPGSAELYDPGSGT
jgi:N-acetylneuraminic acid mutarotase